MAKEFEAAGIPVAYITTLDSLAQSVGANRIIPGKAIVNVTGDPNLRPEDERQFRKELIAKALQALTTPVEGVTILR
jgi:glycine/betaine/sarcosine/D-proline reductase family selenoprotein B